MPTYRDFEMLNSSLGRLGDSLLRNRMIADQQRARETARGDRAREFETTRQDRAREFDQTQSTRREEFGAQQAHWKNIEDASKLQANLRTMANQAAAFKESMAAIGEQVRGGKLTNEEATQFFTESLEEHPDFAAQFQARPEFKAITSGKFDWATAGAPKPAAQPAAVETDVYAAALEEKAAKETDPAVKAVLMERAKTLRSGLGRPDPTKFIEETEVLQRDPSTGNPSVTRKRRIPADQVDKPAAGADDNKPAVAKLRADAHAALKAGKDKKAVAQRFKELTGEDL